MPHLQPMRATSEHVGTVANAVGAVTFMRLPDIPGVGLELLSFHVSVNDSTDGSFVGLSHRLDSTAHTTAAAFLEDTNIWLKTNLTEVGQIMIPSFVVAGRQVLTIFNDSGSTVRYGATLWFRTVRMSLLQWTALKRLTSFEQ